MIKIGFIGLGTMGKTNGYKSLKRRIFSDRQ